MKALRYAPLALSVVLGLHHTARADIPVVQSEDVKLNVGGLAQTLAHAENVNDPLRDQQRAYLFQKAARLRMNGAYKDFGFNLEMALGGENIVAAPSPGMALGFLEMSADVPVKFLGEKSFVRAGQFKVPYGRESLTYLGNTTFADKSLNHLGFGMGYDVGATLNVRQGLATVVAGVFTGGGRDVPERYIPEKLGVPLLVLRAGVGNIDEDLYNLKQQDKVDGLKWGVYANGLYEKDTRIGHSTAMAVKMTDKNLLLNGAWNPFIGKTPAEPGTHWQAGADAVVRAPVGNGMQVSGEAEFNFGEFSNRYGTVQLAAARAQGALSVGDFDFALRYSVMLPDAKFTTGGKQITGEDAFHEVTPAISYKIRGDALKVVADMPILINTPVVDEAGLGTYVLTEMPTTTSYGVKEGGGFRRETVEQGRIMLQAWF